ncbi:MAG: hypothetical protein DWQ58_03160 [Microcystis aeruginosa TA09]|jgi:hypothetical protein|nr:hypothetical protein [Microcystis aeruginosa LG13-13]NCR02475.1 hypothetical protein [Microcystis aeruginosa LG13-03]NCR60674.1 hypothetical protein [Microcystis aeruginosa LG11-05]REJ58594.1 MAG: hypothetical protein DWQ58_03160 [Microcystis aeruginosa TA09]
MKSNRPIGIKILAILAIASGAIAALAGLVNLGFGITLLENLRQQNLPPSPTDHILLTAGGLNVIVGMINLLFGLGFLSLKPWAWLLGVIMQIANIAIIIISLFAGRLPWLLSLLLLIIYGAILSYFFQPRVRQAFNQA